MRWPDLLAGLDVLERRGAATGSEVDVTSIAHDSRRVQRGACFACIPGARTDGHEHARAAVAAGAVALLVERFVDAAVPQARVASVRRALGPAAARLYGEPSRALRCLGVTGTNGKTTTTYLLEAIAVAAGERAGVVGTTGARVAGEAVAVEHTTPEADDLQALLARMRDAGVRSVALEVSSHALAQHRVDGTWFTAACFTNLTHEHLDFHGTMESYFEAKAALFVPGRTAAAAIGTATPWGRELAARARHAGLPVTTWSPVAGDDADLVARAVEVDGRGARFVLVDRADRVETPVALGLLGAFNVENALAAAATAKLAGFPASAVADGLAALRGVPGRLEPVDRGQGFLVLVDYAHTPDALARTLAAARDLAAGHRVTVVFGCGGDRDAAKRPLMGQVAARAADRVVVTSDNPRSEAPAAIAAAVLEGTAGGHATVSLELDRRAAIAGALAGAGPGDVVVVAGKGHETGQTAGGVTVPFDDRVVAREALESLGWR